ncbi:hypothetical protein [Kibdelosporangium philippinense]|uniref:hypothetical protein n=1 Tax=Kibdelosporangium philippinense TaxID=211113 RepID=UPI00361856E8
MVAGALRGHTLFLEPSDTARLGRSRAGRTVRGGEIVSAGLHSLPENRSRVMRP